jgi:phage shock protein C
MNAQSTTNRKLYLSVKDKKISGLCGGIAEYFNFDSSMVRLAWIVFTVLTGIVPGIIAYVVAVMVIPKEGERDE